MEVYNLFPTTVCSFQYGKTAAFREELYKICMDFVKDGISNEVTYPYVHHHPEFEDFYQFVTQSVKEYLDLLKCDNSILDVFITKSWMNVVHTAGNQAHDHSDSHLSFVFYVHVPSDKKYNIRFWDISYDRRMPFNTFVTAYNTSNEWNYNNSSTRQLLPTVGTLYVFPSKLLHDVVVEDPKPNPKLTSKDVVKDGRISIAGDIHITFNRTGVNNKTCGILPIETWRKY